MWPKGILCYLSGQTFQYFVNFLGILLYFNVPCYFSFFRCQLQTVITLWILHEFIWNFNWGGLYMYCVCAYNKKLFNVLMEKCHFEVWIQKKKKWHSKPHEKYNNTILFSCDCGDITSKTIMTLPLGDTKYFER